MESIERQSDLNKQIRVGKKLTPSSNDESKLRRNEIRKSSEKKSPETM